jgi:hypothetical protein
MGRPLPRRANALILLLSLLMAGAFGAGCGGTIQDPCLGVGCSGLGACQLRDGLAWCDCQAGYHAEGTACVVNAGCAGVDCGPNGSCVESGGQPACQCQAGYHPSGLTCVQDDVCAGVDCGPNGSCVESGGQPACQCQAGYHPSGLTCVQDDPTDPYDAFRQQCVDQINAYRATLSMGPLARWTDAESCVDGEAQRDSEANTPHSAFGACGEWAQNECPRWGSVESTVTGCLEMMWNEGPGEPYSEHGHYINMTNPSYSRVACGFYEGPNGVWAAQDFQ